MALQANDQAPAVALLAQRLQALFDGNRQQYFTYKQESPDNRGKLKPQNDKGKRGCDEYRGRAPSVPVWQNYILGSVNKLPLGLGVIASNDANQARWGCIDIDIYPADTALIQAKLDEWKVTAVCLPSKSGGCHVYFFLDTFMACAGLRIALHAIKKRLVREMGFDTNKIDIFPQHDSVDWAAGGTSSCLFMPRLATVEEWVSFTDRAEAAISPLHMLRADSPTQHAQMPSNPADYAKKKLAYHTDLIRNSPNGAKDTTLYGSARFVFRLIRAGWIDNDEAVGAIKSAAQDNGWTQPDLDIKLKSINHRGRDDPPPTVPTGDMPGIDLVRVMRDPVVWDVTITQGDNEYIITEVTAEQLYKLDSFKVTFAKQAPTTWRFTNKPAVWSAMLATAIQVDEDWNPGTASDSSPEWQFRELLEKWLTTTRLNNLEQAIATGRPFLDEEKNCYLFKIVDLKEHISSKKENMLLKWVEGQLRKLGGINSSTDSKLMPRINGKQHRLWKMPETFESENLPVIRGDPPPI